MGVTVTFIAILELTRESLIEIVQTDAYAPIHVRPGSGTPNLIVVADNTPTDTWTIELECGVRPSQGHAWIDI